MTVESLRHKRRPALRLVLRQQRRKARRRGDWKEASRIRQVLHDRDMQDELLERLEDTYSEELRATAIGDGTFLKWLVENWEVILKLVLTIIGMFSVEVAIETGASA